MKNEKKKNFYKLHLITSTQVEKLKEFVDMNKTKLVEKSYQRILSSDQPSISKWTLFFNLF